MQRSKHVVLISMFLALAMLCAMNLAACGDKGETTTMDTLDGTDTTPMDTLDGTDTTPGETEEGDPLVIGVINSITGANAYTGAEQKWAQEKAASDINAKGGILLNDGKLHKVQLKFYDDQSLSTEATLAMEKAIKTDGITIFLGSNTTPNNQAAAMVAEQYQVYYHMNTSWTDEASPDGSFPGFIGGMDLEWATDIFESATDAILPALGVARALTEPISKFAVMTVNNPDGIGFGFGTAMVLEAEGWKVVANETFDEGSTDFTSIILKFREADVEGIVTLISSSDGITFVEQMKEQGWSPKFLFGYSGFWPVDFMQALGPDSDYICFDGFWSERYPYPYAEELGQAFRDDHDGKTSVSIGLPYAAAQILFMAIERAGVFEPGPVRDEVFGGTFAGTTMGDITYNEKGIADIPFLGFQWMGGERVVLYPTEFATGTAHVFTPWEQR